MGARRLRPVASFHFERRLERSAAGRGTRDPGGQADRGRQRSPCRRRHGAAEEGVAFGRGRAAIRLGARQDRQLPNAGVADAGAGRGSGDDRPAPVSAGELDRRPDRMAKARVPENWRAARTKPEIALAEIDRIRAAGVRFATVLADAGYGLSAPFRQGLDARGLKWAVGIPKQQKVYPSNVRLVFPIAGRGRPRKRHIPDQLSAPAEDVLTTAKWRRVSWRKGTKGPLAASFAAVRVRIADGPPQRIHEKGMQHMPGEEAWLVGERRASGERKYYLSNLPPDANLKTLAAAIKARWVCEQAHQQLKEELGLDHFEGRSWHGLHRHTLMTMIAYAYLQSRRLAEASGEKESAKGRPSRRCPRSGAPCSPFSLARRHIDVPIAAEPSQDASNKSAKVVLDRLLQPKGVGLSAIRVMARVRGNGRIVHRTLLEKGWRISIFTQNMGAGEVSSRSICSAFAGVAARFASAPALVCDGVQISYADLDRVSTRISVQLRHAGLRRGQIVGLIARRSIEATAAILGILKAGGAYLPLDISYPPELLRYICNDSRSKPNACRASSVRKCRDFKFLGRRDLLHQSF